MKRILSFLLNDLGPFGTFVIIGLLEGIVFLIVSQFTHNKDLQWGIAAGILLSLVFVYSFFSLIRNIKRLSKKYKHIPRDLYIWDIWIPLSVRKIALIAVIFISMFYLLIISFVYRIIM